MPFRILGTLTETLEAGRSIERLALPLAAWMRFVALRAKTGEAITDPLHDALSEIGSGATGDAHTDVAAFLALDSVFPPALARDPTFVEAVEKAYVELA